VHHGLDRPGLDLRDGMVVRRRPAGQIAGTNLLQHRYESDDTVAPWKPRHRSPPVRGHAFRGRHVEYGLKIG
jgi:hypothetical protein